MRRIFAVALTVASLAQSSCDWFRAQPPATPVQTIHPKRSTIVRRIPITGTLIAYSEATLYEKVAGYLKRINVDKGDAVKEGDLVAEIEAPEMLADLVKARTEAEAAQLEYKRVTDAQKKASDLVVPQAVDAAKAKSGVAVAGLQRIETLLGYAKITAPFSGVITKRWVDPGALIPAPTSSTAAKSAAVVTLMDFRTVRLEPATPDPNPPLVQKNLPV